MKQRLLLHVMAVALIVSLPTSSVANTVRNHLQTVKDTVIKVTADWDFTLKAATPFGDNGFVDIVNTEHAVLIIEKVRPSATLNLLSHVLINGETAKDGANCQVKLYNRGTIIMPYAKDIKPLTVYSEQNFEGDAVNSFGLENSGGYMNTLSTTKLNNKIRSFKLKRGYMVTFSTLPSGRGYSRCFIAASADLEVKELPAVLDQKISSYRIFKWYDAGKKQLANYMNKEALTALNVQSSYDWAQGNDSFLPDFEWVPNHIYEDWPSSATIGGTSQSPHCKNNNEPRNSSDDHPQDLETILGNWENMMRTGLRLCSPASWDGSDYWNATGFLADFLDSIDARGWRCDLIDLHCYWAEGSFNNMHYWSDKYKRPIWISEWCWGASWNNNGAFANGVTAAQVKTALQNICTKLNGWDYVERYYYWNGERDPSKLYKDGALTPAGEYYASMTTDLAYKSTKYIPSAPKQKAASKLSVAYDKKARTAQLSWYDNNGEYNRAMTVERSDDKGTTWVTIDTIAQKENPSDYTFTDSKNVYDGVAYRIHILDLNGVNRNTAAVYTQIENVELGDALTVEGQPLYVGGNLLTNGDFSQGMQGWTSGTGETIGQPFFQVVRVGGPDGGSYLQAYGHQGANDAASLKTYVAVQPNTYYYIRCASRNGGSNMAVNVCPDNTSTGTAAVKFSNSGEWQDVYKTFNSGSNSYALISFSNLGAKAQFDKLELRQLFTTSEAAQADGVDHQPVDAEVLLAESAKQTIDSLLTVADVLVAYKYPTHNDLLTKVAAARVANAPADIISACEQLKEAVAVYLPMTEAATQPQSSRFTSTTGWETKVGTFTGGDQRTNTVGGKTCWNAWWSNLSASEGTAKTMEIRQTISGLTEGLYKMECKSTTEHYCLSDQHGYIVSGEEVQNTPYLTFDYFDLPTVGNMWETLTTPPVYVPNDGSVTIGFKSSKQGAVDNAWRQVGNSNSTGDKREGWWCATDFRLLFCPVMKMTVTPGQWATICLEYATTIPQGMKCYRVAGILKDHTRICLEELSELAAGQAAVYRSDAADLLFCEYGEAASEPISYTSQNNLRGYLRNGLANAGYYELIDGIWTAVTARKRSGANVAYLTSLDGLPEFDSWEGISLPIAGGTDGIQGVSTDIQPTTVYTIGGRRSANSRGVVIENRGKTIRKVLQK